MVEASSMERPAKLLRAFAVLFGVLAIMNLSKPLELSPDHGFVLLGRRLHGTSNLIAAPVFGVFQLCYAIALWRARPYALPMGLAYGGYVAANLFLFNLHIPELTTPVRLYGPLYIALAIGVSWGSVAVMFRERVGVESGVATMVMLRMFALLFSLMALSDLLTPFADTMRTGFVLFGQRLTGTANAVVAPLFALFLAGYAYSIWTERRVALPLGVAYAVYVVANLVSWSLRKPAGETLDPVFAVLYLIVAVGVSSGAAVLLYRRRRQLEDGKAPLS